MICKYRVYYYFFLNKRSPFSTELKRNQASDSLGNSCYLLKSFNIRRSFKRCTYCFRVKVEYKCGSRIQGSAVRFWGQKIKALRNIKNMYDTAKGITNVKKTCLEGYILWEWLQYKSNNHAIHTIATKILWFG